MSDLDNELASLDVPVPIVPKGRERILSLREKQAAWLIALNDAPKKQIAKICGMSEHRLSKLCRDKVFRQEVEDRSREILQDMVSPALRRLRLIIMHGKDYDALKASELVLRAGGHLDTKKKQTEDGDHDDDLARIEELAAANDAAAATYGPPPPVAEAP
jgi:predicted mannosyl-3-phosphoglycerate phosphatase (HAD superfamily)